MYKTYSSRCSGGGEDGYLQRGGKFCGLYRFVQYAGEPGRSPDKEGEKHERSKMKKWRERAAHAKLAWLRTISDLEKSAATMKAASSRSRCSATGPGRGAAVGVGRCWRAYLLYRPADCSLPSCLDRFRCWPLAHRRGACIYSYVVIALLRPNRLALSKSIRRNRCMYIGRRRARSLRGRLSSSPPRK